MSLYMKIIEKRRDQNNKSSTSTKPAKVMLEHLQILKACQSAPTVGQGSGELIVIQPSART
eukprot:scaffold8287_cov32-Prasinocladus_malaysianus.AAC.1